MREALSTWSLQPILFHHDIMSLVRSDQYLPLDFMGVGRDAYKKMLVQSLTDEDKGNLRMRVGINLTRSKLFCNVLASGILTQDELAALGLSGEQVRAVLLSDGYGDRILRLVEEVDLPGSNLALEVNAIAYRLAILKALGCLDLVDSDAIAENIAANQIARDWQSPAGYKVVNAEKAAGLFYFGLCDLSRTRGALWSLQILGKLDLIDKESYLEAILSFYQWRGRFRSDYQVDGIQFLDHDEDTLFAMESLAILDGLDRVEDFSQRSFAPKTTSRKVDGEMQYGLVTSRALIACAYQLRLEELRGS